VNAFGRSLYRQSQIYARAGVELDRSTLAEWVGGSSRLLAPLPERVQDFNAAIELVYRRQAIHQRHPTL